jgi:molybdenum cofactor cytidylyltransferase
MAGICAIILAAGESKRMGSPKMLLDFNGKTMLETVIGNVRDSDVDDILVVLGAYRSKLERIVRNTGVRSCYNDIYKDGMLSSVKCGFRNIPHGAEAVLVYQGDQPFITSKVTNKVIEEHINTGKGIVIPVFKNRMGHPLLVGKKYFMEIEKLDQAKGLRSLAEIFSDDVAKVSVDEGGILRDFDTFEDYRKEINQIH